MEFPSINNTADYTANYSGLDSRPSATELPGIDSTARQQTSDVWINPKLFLPLSGCPPHPLFTTEQLGIDRRLLVNRKRQLKMYRVWMQGKFRKIEGGDPGVR